MTNDARPTPLTALLYVENRSTGYDLVHLPLTPTLVARMLQSPAYSAHRPAVQLAADYAA